MEIVEPRVAGCSHRTEPALLRPGPGSTHHGAERPCAGLWSHGSFSGARCAGTEAGWIRRTAPQGRLLGVAPIRPWADPGLGTELALTRRAVFGSPVGETASLGLVPRASRSDGSFDDPSGVRVSKDPHFGTDRVRRGARHMLPHGKKDRPISGTASRVRAKGNSDLVPVDFPGNGLWRTCVRCAALLIQAAGFCSCGGAERTSFGLYSVHCREQPAQSRA